MRRFLSAGLAIASLISAACASAPPPPVAPPEPPAPSIEQRMSWILRFEDQRVLRDAPVDAVPPDPVVPTAAPVAAPPDLLRLLQAREARIRRRAALAAGRVGLSESVPPLVTLLSDPEPEVRQVAAFALGLVGDATARDPLITALTDTSPLVQGSAAEALGMIGDAMAAEPIARMATAIIESGALATLPDAAGEEDRSTPAAAFRLAMNALARLKAVGPLASVVLDPGGQPRVRWWPVADALQRLEDPRTLPALRALAADPQPYTRAFAVKGIGTLADRESMPLLMALVKDGDRTVAAEALRALARIGDPVAAKPLADVVRSTTIGLPLRAEAATGLGTIGGEGAVELLTDLLIDRSPSMRAAALRGLARLDPEGFVFILSGLDSDPHWSVRASLATVLGTLTSEAALRRLGALRQDADARVVPAALASLVALKAPNADQTMVESLKHDDPVVRAAAATALGTLQSSQGAPAALAQAYEFGQRDSTYVARAAALAALAKYGRAAAEPLLAEALKDKDWAVRVRAAALMREFDSATDANQKMRPAPSSHPEDFYSLPRLIDPAVSTQAYLETDRGMIQIELAVLDAPLTVENFVNLARKGFYDGQGIHRVVPGFVIQGGDPRGDSEGGAGYTIRDELNERPFLRGTVGMALDWEDTGSSQFFITASPQPQLDGRYTVFGRVISGMEVVDQIEPWDVIRRVRIWDGDASAKD